MDRTGWPEVPDTLGVTRWLCFESKGEKRRLSPVPPEWRAADSTELARMLARARPVGKQKIDRVDEVRDGSH